MAARQLAFDFIARLAQSAFAPVFEPNPAPTPSLPSVAEVTLAPELALAHRLSRLLARPVRVSFTDNRRTMISVRKPTSILASPVIELRLHHMFAHADVATLAALARYLESSDRQAAETLGRFIKLGSEKIRSKSRARVVLRSQGLHHDLLAHYTSLNGEYFDNTINARITWAKRTEPLRRRRSSIKLGSYHSRDRLIRVHPALDADWVPDVFVRYIVFHEMLHEHVPTECSGGRRSMHGPRFRAREREFAEYAEAIAWEKRNLDRLLRA